MYLVTTILVFMTIVLVIHEEMEPGKKTQAEKKVRTDRRKVAAKMRRKAQTRQQEATL